MNNKTEKEDCKYWDKCYQKNEKHLQTYNHPQPEETQCDAAIESTAQSSSPRAERQLQNKVDENARKRKNSDTGDDNVITKKNNAQMVWQNPNESYAELAEDNKFIHEKFLVEMPQDFYQFWDFTKCLSKDMDKHPFNRFNFQLVGPFDFMAGRFAKTENKSPGDYLRHWRFFYDPPEFQTIIVKKGTGIHYGYWRDDPKEKDNILIARNDAEKGCEIEIIATNLFDAFAYFLEKDYIPDPFSRKHLSDIRKAINGYVVDENLKRRPLLEAKKERMKNVIAKSFHGAGIVVPVDKKSKVGYRPLSESDANVKKILSILDNANDKAAAKEVVLEKLQPIITAAVIALDECDFGSGLELGIDLFCSGHEELHEASKSLLKSAYMLVGRPQYAAIIKAHLEDRKKSFDLSIIK